MTNPSEPNEKTEKVGLCNDCVHARDLESDRGSAFLLCELSFSDSRYPKYPRLPVFSCDGHKKRS